MKAENADFERFEDLQRFCELQEQTDPFFEGENFQKKDGKHKTLWNAVKKSKCSFSQSLPFLSAVQLDEDKLPESRLQLKKLFITWCSNGNFTWLNPCPLLFQLDEILRLFIGPRKVLVPIIQQLLHFAEKGISPHAFLTYIILPRMADDYNWRGWDEKHFGDLDIVGKLLLRLKKSPPFDTAVIGDGPARLARDVVLVKYIGKPLSKLSPTQLADTTMLKEYETIWKSLSLRSSRFIGFLRRNFLGPLYTLSGKIDFRTILDFLTFAPYLERHIPRLPIETVSKISFFDENLSKTIEKKLSRGYSYTSIADEACLSFSVVNKSCDRANPPSILSNYTRLFKKALLPTESETIERLFLTIPAGASLHTHRWHLDKLKYLELDAIEDFFKNLKQHGGIDPEYPRADIIFQEPENRTNTIQLQQFAESLALGKSKIGSYRTLVEQYILAHPDVGKEIQRLSADLIAGQEAQWTTEKWNHYSKICETIYEPFMKSLIPGLSVGFYSLPKGKDLISLKSRFQVPPIPKSLIQRSDFHMPVKEQQFHLTVDEELTKKINIKSIVSQFDLITVEPSLSRDKLSRDLNTALLRYRQPIQDKLDEIRQLENEQPVQEKKLKTARKSLTNLQDKQNKLRSLIEEFEATSLEGKFIIAIICAGYFAQANEELVRSCISWILHRASTPDIRKKIQFLKLDISDDSISYEQIEHIINTFDSILYSLSIDSRLSSSLKNSDEDLLGAVRPFVVTKRKSLEFDAIEASFKRACGYGKLMAEKSKWLEILEKRHSRKTIFKSMSVYSSKTPIDAYYGDMGGICLSEKPEAIIHRGFMVLRLTDNEELQFRGSAIAFLNEKGCQSTGGRPFWMAFSINPLYSFIRNLGGMELLYLYLQFRKIFESLAEKTGYSVILPGISTWGIVTNNELFKQIILKYELSKKPGVVYDARGLSFHYSEEQYAHGLLIIDSKIPATKTAARDSAVMEVYFRK